jgi:hypothetical protein
MSRRVYLLGIGLALVALALALTDWVLSLQPGVTETNVKRIKDGMTLDQVEALLGGPGSKGHQPPPKGVRVRFYGFSKDDRDYHWEYHWTGASGYVSVTFVSPWGVPEGCRRVEHARFVRTASSSPFQRLRAWLGW